MSWRSTPALAVATLVLASTSLAQAPGSWFGQKVVTKYRTPLRQGRRVVDNDAVHRTYRVEDVFREWLWLVSGSATGWVRSCQFVPHDQAIDFYTQEIRANPGAANAYLLRGILWEERGEKDIALADFNEAIRLDPDDATAFIYRGYLWNHHKEYDKAIADYNEAVRLDPKLAGAFNSRAWLLSTCPDPKFRDGSRAVESAGRACELTDWKKAHHIDTLAAAYAESGDFEKAVEWQEMANKLYTDSDDRRKGEERLKHYKEKKPYRDEG